MEEAIEIITNAAYDCFDVPNDYYVLEKNPGEYILNKLKEAGYEIRKVDKKDV